MEQRTAWVTGSSRGVGRAIAEKLASKGVNVVLHGRNRTNLRSSGEGIDLQEIAGSIAAQYQVKCRANFKSFGICLLITFVAGATKRFRRIDNRFL